MKTTSRALIAASALSLTLLAACGDDDDSASALDCDLGAELSATFAEFATSDGPPSVADLEAVAGKLDRFDAPAAIAEEVEIVREGVQTLITELGDPDPDFEAVGTAGEAMSTAGQTIDAHIEDNCP